MFYDHAAHTVSITPRAFTLQEYEARSISAVLWMEIKLILQPL